MHGLHPWPACEKDAGGRYHRYDQTPAFPAQWFDGLYVLSSGTGSLAPVCDNARSAHCAGISTGMPGPHDFAVRSRLFVGMKFMLQRLRPPHHRLAHRDDRDTPSCRDGTATYNIIFCKNESGIFLSEGLDLGDPIEAMAKISFSAQR